ncbi:MAG: hypothetical protein AAF684_03400, partial [Pseudomonadota bacterium]
FDAGPDRRLRRPDLAHAIAVDRGWLPNRARTVKIVGSKGKGGVARRIADGLRAAGQGPVGLFVSPEERDHNDRIRIDGAPLPPPDFASLWREIAPFVADASRRRDPPVASPFGALHLMALAAFRRAGVRWAVLEAGRGGRWDEVGWTPAAVGVATRLLPEHRDRLGRDVAAIADQKLGGLGDVDRLFVHPSFAPYLHRPATVVPCPQAKWDRPRWLGETDALADAALHALGVPPPPATLQGASFIRRRIGDLAVIADGAIHADCVDRAFYAAQANAAAVIAVPADKDVAGLVAAVRTCGLPCSRLDLIGPRGAGPAIDDGAVPRLAAVEQTDHRSLAAALAEFAATQRVATVILFGDQTALRLVRRFDMDSQ